MTKVYSRMNFNIIHSGKRDLEYSRNSAAMSPRRCGMTLRGDALRAFCLPRTTPRAETIEAPRTSAATPAGADHHNAIGTQRSDGL